MTAADTKTAPPRTRPRPPVREKVLNTPPWWKPMIWVGCDFFGWVRLLARNRFDVHRSYLHVVAYVSVVSLFNSVLRWVQGALWGRRIARVIIREAPIFIIGHWRTGTTLLHEYLALDERHAFPTTYDCMEPNHFLLTERLMTRWLPFLAPTRRPMDNMAAGFERPQEDEFALCMLGLPSPYLSIAFPDHPPQYPEYLDLEGLSPRALAAWKRGFLRFLQALTYKHRKRLILKSPTHSCRVKVLLDMFPDARFVHIVRDPYVVFPSTKNLWKSLYLSFGLQRSTFDGLDERVLDNFVRVYEKIDEAKASIDFDRFYELRYEDLTRDPIGQMGALYDHLGLGGFEQLRPRLEKHLAGVGRYEKNNYQLTPEQTAKITARWGDVIRNYGYSVRPEASSPQSSATGTDGRQPSHTASLS